MSAGTKLSPCSPLYIAFSNHQPPKGHDLRYHRLSRKRRLTEQTKEKTMAVLVKKEMEIKNFKLYMENKSIIEENEKLKKKAILLHQENQALFYQLQKKSSNPLHDHLAHNNKKHLIIWPYISM